MNQTLILGKILLLIIVSIFAFANNNISSYLNQKTAIKGDTVLFTITASGKDIKFPQITDIGGNPVIGTSNSSQVKIINGEITQQKTIQYQFIVNKTFRVPRFTVVVDGKKFKTEKEALKVIPPKTSQPGDNFQLKLKIDKKDVYVGEAIKTTFEFKYKKDIRVLDLNLEELKQKHLWVKALEAQSPTQRGRYNIIKQEYIIFPQLAGKIKIDKQVIGVGVENPRGGGFFNSMKTINVYSNDLEINVKPLPKDISIQGDYQLKASVDKNIVDANKPINLTIEIKGFGNIDDIDSIDMKLDNEVVYNTKPNIKAYLEDGKYGGVFTQKFSIIGNSNFTVPSIEFKYFDIKARKVKVLKSKSFKIKVNKQTKIAPKIETKSIEYTQNIENQSKIIFKKEDENLKYFYALGGFLFGILITLLFKNKVESNKKSKNIDIQIKKAKSDKALYKILLPYSHKVELDETMRQLEENIYNKGKNKINKKELILKL
jgi:hypothetical protein